MDSQCNNTQLIYLYLALWKILFTMNTLYNPPLTRSGHVFSQILSGHFHFTVFIAARNVFKNARGQVVLFKYYKDKIIMKHAYVKFWEDMNKNMNTKYDDFDHHITLYNKVPM